MKKFFSMNHPGFFVYVLGIGFIFFGIWLPDAPFWLDLEKYTDKVFNRWFTISQIAIGVGIAMFAGGLLWIHSSSTKEK